MRLPHPAAIAALALSLGLPLAALAAGPDERTTIVHVRRPAVTSPAAARRLELRLADAALEACGAPAGSLAEVKADVRRSRCWQDSYAGAVAQVRGSLAQAGRGLPSSSGLTAEP